MVGSFLGNLAPRIEPEQRRYRAQVARAVIAAVYVLLGIWLVADIGVALWLGRGSGYNFGFDLASMASLAALGALALRLVNRGRIVFAGYLLASALFLVVLVSILTFPEYIYLVSAGFLIAILIAGSVVGGTSVYPFAVGGLVDVFGLALRSKRTRRTGGGDRIRCRDHFPVQPGHSLPGFGSRPAYPLRPHSPDRPDTAQPDGAADLLGPNRPADRLGQPAAPD
jgi:hypothetical protein